MYKTVFSSLIVAFLVSISLSAAAAPGKSVDSMSSGEELTQAQQSAKVNLNAADVETLSRDLSGIGAAKAKAIVAYRESNGPFTAVDELLEVKGIGKALLEKNRDRLVIQ
ncbi:ComEA family DNA-binding protein [Pseudomonas sessilinigenes]|uniref:Helix-hairpin-helix domain-containing protein n=1 Tax=Pseudomonas sessilinigenes TaxID=658629 RepID=A0ABX8MGF4_9PSED|nr:ComEA family DNA-binding protein [Pseudomonas sessilinigenes]AZC27853.1 Competence protein ComEA helix-hairpin-helix region precursor [Pseudomonas sessilinigenes]QXH38268.1 helix-hairpin-helix domain-containing protein [Pseudomonas sessilinigenes]